MIGVSIGLGNVWRFPYMMGEYGGSAFLFIYLLFTLIFAIPAVMAEWGLGRGTRQGPIGAFSVMWGKKTGIVIGCMLMTTVFVAESYYIYVIANVGFSTVFSAASGFDSDNLSSYSESLNDPFLQYTIAVFLLAISYLILSRGLKKGIESISKIFVPFFAVAILFLILFALQLENASQHLLEFLSPNFEALETGHVFAALGQAFFSLGLGGTFLLVFGSFMRDDENLVKSSAYVAVGDVGAAILVGLFIVPTVLSLGLDMSQGPGLLFSTLPELFQRLPYGQVVGTLFLFSLFMVTFISSLAALEVVITGVHDAFNAKYSRKRIIQVICLLEVIMVLPISITPSIIGTLDLIFGSGMQVLGSMLVLLALTWGQSKRKALLAVFGESDKPWHTFYYYWIKWFVPAVLLSVLVGYIVSNL
jgi:NSS family neurotransmitter:Na+ symporter